MDLGCALQGWGAPYFGLKKVFLNSQWLQEPCMANGGVLPALEGFKVKSLGFYNFNVL